MTTSTRFRNANLLKARTARGLSQSQLAERIGAHFTSISDWERGKNTPSARHLASLSRELGEPVDFFFAADSSEEDEEESAVWMDRALMRRVEQGHLEIVVVRRVSA